MEAWFKDTKLTHESDFGSETGSIRLKISCDLVPDISVHRINLIIFCRPTSFIKKLIRENTTKIDIHILQYTLIYIINPFTQTQYTDYGKRNKNKRIAIHHHSRWIIFVQTTLRVRWIQIFKEFKVFGSGYGFVEAVILVSESVTSGYLSFRYPSKYCNICKYPNLDSDL